MLSLVYRHLGHSGLWVPVFSGLALFFAMSSGYPTVPVGFIRFVLLFAVSYGLVRAALWASGFSKEKKAVIKKHFMFYAPILFPLIPLKVLFIGMPVFPFLAAIVLLGVLFILISRKLRQKGILSPGEVARLWLFQGLFLVPVGFIFLVLAGVSALLQGLA